MKITSAHGAGGKLMEAFIREYILGSFESVPRGSVNLSDLDDGASYRLDSAGSQETVLTSDSHTVKPLFFPGGDIGKLAACGTINDLAVMGAEPLALSCNLVVEEGFSLEKLKQILQSMNLYARESGASIVTGDTKVMESGRVDELVVGTTGMGLVHKGTLLSDSSVEPGDRILVSGTVGDHGISLLAFREGFSTELTSDVASILPIMDAALKSGGIHAAKDPTRGGLANALNEWAEKARVAIEVEEERISLREEVSSLAELLGMDPLVMACEGRAILAVEEEKAEEVLSAIRKLPQGREAAIIGEAVEGRSRVVLKTEVGGKRIMDRPLADPVPRIC